MAKVSLKAGNRFKSVVCDAQVMVIKAPAGEYELSCGGADMVVPSGSAPEGVSLDESKATGTLIGKRYVNADETLELLCTKGGKGGVSINGAALEVKQAKQLPSSD